MRGSKPEMNELYAKRISHKGSNTAKDQSVLRILGVNTKKNEYHCYDYAHAIVL